MLLRKKPFLLILSLFVLSLTLQAQNCDPWIVDAYKHLYNRAPSAEECNIRNYNNGSWGNYNELVSHIKSYNARKASTPAPAASNCDQWIVSAYKQLYGRMPSSEECNIRNYNNGSWSSYNELVNHIKSYNARKQAASAPAAPVSNCDQWIVKIYKELYGRAPSAEECNIRNYNNGSWGSYNELLGYVKAYKNNGTATTPPPAAAPKKNTEVTGDPWIFQAYKELFNRKPNAWEVNTKLYNNGSWSNYAQLKNYVRDYQKAVKDAGLNITVTDLGNGTSLVTFDFNNRQEANNLINSNGGGVIAAGGMNVAEQLRQGGYVVAPGSGNVIAPGGGNVIAPGSGNVIAPGGGNVIAPGAGNVIAPGGGNVIAPGGGNLRIDINAAGVTFGSPYRVQSAGTRVVKTSGNGAMIFSRSTSNTGGNSGGPRPR